MAKPAANGVYHYDFFWSLPTCTTTIQRQAGLFYENLECSGRGSCDRKSGLCECFPGYDGGNCGQNVVVV